MPNAPGHSTITPTNMPDRDTRYELTAEAPLVPSNVRSNEPGDRDTDSPRMPAVLSQIGRYIRVIRGLVRRGAGR